MAPNYPERFFYAYIGIAKRVDVRETAPIITTIP